MQTKNLNREARRIAIAVTLNLNGSPISLYSRKRTAAVAWARMIAMWLIRKRTEANYEEIGQHFNRAHTTARYAFVTVEDRLKTDAHFARLCGNIEESIH